jgi:septal ring factor EnvC (AmiA/AmiB activator)
VIYTLCLTIFSEVQNKIENVKCRFSNLIKSMDLDEKETLYEVIATQTRDNEQSVAVSAELDFASQVKQQFSENRRQNSEVRQQIAEVKQQMQELNSEVRQQFLELTQQMSLQSRQFHSLLSTLMLQGEEHQQIKSSQQHLHSLSTTDTQHAATAERQALMDDTCHVQLAATAADIGAPRHADDRTEQDTAMLHHMYSTCCIENKNNHTSL